mmetsp:Transcript_538/g.1257  ORF Transcript_538/g.1257 Transcript_538/m.1257 type:complete len:418 (+) Transcript_538:322-1575(+)
MQVIVTHSLLDCFSCLLGVIEGNLREDVMAHVRVRDVVETVVEEGTKRAVHSAQGSAQPAPLRVIKVWHVHIGVLQERDQDQVVVGDHVRNQVVRGDKGESVSVNAEAKEGQSHEESNIRLNDLPVLIFREHHCTWREVVGILALVFGRSSHVQHQVARHPADGEHHDDVEGVSQRAVSDRLAHLRAHGRTEHLIIGTRACVAVVLSMGDSPGVVRHQQQAVQNSPNEVVHRLIRGETLVATLVGQHPDASEEGALKIPVGRPKQHIHPQGKVVATEISVTHIKGGGHESKVGGEVSQRRQQAPFEAVLGNGISDIGEGEGRLLQWQVVRGAIRIQDASSIRLQGRQHSDTRIFGLSNGNTILFHPSLQLLIIKISQLIDLTATISVDLVSCNLLSSGHPAFGLRFATSAHVAALTK